MSNDKRLEKKFEKDFYKMEALLFQCSIEKHPLYLKRGKTSEELRSKGHIQLTDGNTSITVDLSRLEVFMNEYCSTGDRYVPNKLRIKGYVLVWCPGSILVKYDELGNKYGNVKVHVDMYGNESDFDELSNINELLMRYKKNYKKYRDIYGSMVVPRI